MGDNSKRLRTLRIYRHRVARQPAAIASASSQNQPLDQGFHVELTN